MKRCECQLNAELKQEMAGLYDTEKELPFVTHKPNECKCVNNLKQYWKKGRKVWLCSNCVMGENEVEQKQEQTK